MSEPELVASLATDEAGHPTVVDRKARKHFQIVFEVKNAPKDTYAAIFELDRSYYDSRRTLPPDPDGNFRLVTSAYGDFPLVVRLHTKHGEEIVLRENVAEALRRSRPSGPSDPSYAEALDYIATH